MCNDKLGQDGIPSMLTQMPAVATAWKKHTDVIRVCLRKNSFHTLQLIAC